MAATDAKAIPVKGQAYRVTFPILDADGDLVTGAAGLDSEVSKDGGTFADATNEATEIATSSGMYFLDLTATEMDADTVAIIVKTTTTGAKTTPIVLYTAARNINDLAFPATSGRSIQVEADGMVHGDLKEWLGTVPNALVSGRVDSRPGALAAGVIDAAAIGTAAIDADAIAADAITAAKIAAGAIVKGDELTGLNDLSAAQVNAEVDAALDTAIPASPVANSINERIRDLDDAGIIRRGTAQAGTFTNITLDAGASAINDFYRTLWCVLVGGVGVGQARFIAAYNGTTKVATTEGTWVTDPDATSVFILVAVAGVDLVSWRNQIPNSLATGRVNSVVGAMQSNVLDAAAIATGAIDADALAANAITSAKIATDAIGSVQFAQDAADKVWLSATRTLTSLGASLVQEIWDRATSALTTVGSIGKLIVDNLNATISSRATPAQVNAEVVDALTVDTLADSYAADGSLPTIGQAVLAIKQFLEERAVSGTTVTVKKPDGTTTAMTFTLNDATNPTSITRTT